jgi:hypothetical protein
MSGQGFASHVTIFAILTNEEMAPVLKSICHQGMARPQVADGGDGPQIWRVAASVLNKQ